MPRPIYFPGHNVVIAKDQPPYIPLPAQFFGDNEGTCLTCWEFDEDELAQIQATRLIWAHHLTFNGPFQPLMLSAERPVFDMEVVSNIRPEWGGPVLPTADADPRTLAEGWGCMDDVVIENPLPPVPTYSFEITRQKGSGWCYYHGG